MNTNFMLILTFITIADAYMCLKIHKLYISVVIGDIKAYADRFA